MDGDPALGGRRPGLGQGYPDAGGDRPYLAFDFSSGPARGVGYVVYSIRATILDKAGPVANPRAGTAPILEVRRSDDQGRTWTKAAVGVTSAADSFPTATGAAVLSDGSLVTLWLKRTLPKEGSEFDPALDGPKELHVSTAAAGAELFRRSVKVSDFLDDRPESGSFYSLAHDATTGPGRDRLYAVWTDRRDGPRSRILLSHSADRGATWSAPIRVNATDPVPPPPALDDYQPTVAVNRDGIVGVSWRRRTRNDEDADVWFAASRDRGTSWLPAARVSAASGEVLGGVARPALRPEDDGVSPTSRRLKF